MACVLLLAGKSAENKGVMLIWGANNLWLLSSDLWYISLTAPSFSFYSETVKFGHVTFFWNGNRSGYFNAEMEEYVEIPSDSGITFNEQPLMKAVEIAEKARDAILSRKFHQVIENVTDCSGGYLMRMV